MDLNERILQEIVKIHTPLLFQDLKSWYFSKIIDNQNITFFQNNCEVTRSAWNYSIFNLFYDWDLQNSQAI